MRITRTSPYSGKQNTLDLPVTESQLLAYQSGGYLQDVFPQLNASEREFIHTGYTNDDWNEMFGKKYTILYEKDGWVRPYIELEFESQEECDLKIQPYIDELDKQGLKFMGVERSVYSHNDPIH